jgi:CRISPR-associated protein Csb2
VKARLDGEPKGAQVIAPGDAAGPGQDVVRVACAEPLKTGRDQEWMQELAYSTAKMFKEKRSSPPALRRVSYVQSRDAVVNWVPALAKKKPQEIRAFELSLSSPVLPLATETVRFAEKIRNAWLSCCKTIGGASRWVAGKDESGEPLRGAHEHVFLLPQPDSLGRIRKVLVFAKQLEQRDVDGLLSLREVRQFEERPIRVAVTWMGEAEKAPFFREVDEVISLTPYAPVRHWRKGRGEAQDFARIDAVQECIRHGLITPDLASAVQVEKVERMEGPFHQALYRMSRKREEPRRLGVALRIKFPKKVRTPFSLGYGCHFGLGQFRPVSDDPAR